MRTKHSLVLFRQTHLFPRIECQTGGEGDIFAFEDCFVIASVGIYSFTGFEVFGEEGLELFEDVEVGLDQVLVQIEESQSSKDRLAILTLTTVIRLVLLLIIQDQLIRLIQIIQHHLEVDNGL